MSYIPRLPMCLFGERENRTCAHPGKPMKWHECMVNGPDDFLACIGGKGIFKPHIAIIDNEWICARIGFLGVMPVKTYGAGKTPCEAFKEFQNHKMVPEMNLTEIRPIPSNIPFKMDDLITIPLPWDSNTYHATRTVRRFLENQVLIYRVGNERRYYKVVLDGIRIVD